MNCCSSCIVTHYCLKGVLHQQPTEESENFLIESFRMFRKCSNTLFERASEKKIKIFFCEFERMKSEKGEADASVFRRFLPNNCRAEAAKLKEEMKVLYDVKCSGNAWTSSFLPSEVAFRGIVFGELESLLCVLSADSKGTVAEDLPGCVPAIVLWRTISRIGTDVLPAQQHLRAIPVAAEGVRFVRPAGASDSV